jgi:Kef-type K+ transport system membrane component KefB
VNPLLVVLLLALIGLIGARLTLSHRQVPLGPRISIAIGLPFLFLGFALGPNLLQVLPGSAVDQLTPLLALGLGWIGLLFGLQLDRDHLRQFPRRYLAITLVQASVAFLVVLAVGLLAIVAGFSRAAGPVVLAAAATACVSTPAAIALISNTYMARGRVTRLLFYVASLDAAVGIVAIGVTHAIYHTAPIGAGPIMSPIEWLAISVLLGFFFGVLFLSLTRIRPRNEEFMLLLIGLVLFAAGTAFFLGLSPLLVAMITGVVIGNLSPLRRRVYAALADWEKPIYVMLLVLAGALLRFPSWWIVPLVAAYVVGRILAKLAGGYLASRVALEDVDLPKRLGLGLTPQGGISLAIAISFVLIYVPDMQLEAAVDVFFATVVIAVGISDLVGPFLVRNLLERAGELERAPVQAGVGDAPGGG